MGGRARSDIGWAHKSSKPPLPDLGLAQQQFDEGVMMRVKTQISF
jgi:hypothetical protein